MAEPESGRVGTLLSSERDEELEIRIETVFYEAPPGTRRRRGPAMPAAPMPAAPPPVAPTPVPPTAEPAYAAAPRAVERASPWHTVREVQWRAVRFQTWQLALVCGFALIIGMMVGYATLSSGSSAKRTAPPASKAPTTIKSTATPSGVATAAPTTALPAPRTTAPAGAGAPAHAVLLDLKRETGPLTTSHFTVTGARWALGWAYDCTAPGASRSFKVSIRNADGTPSADGGVDQQGAKGSSVAAYTSNGERFLAVETPCVWAVKVTS